MNGKAALVTGSARGTGRGLAEILLENKVKVCLSDINVLNGQKTLAQLQEQYGASHVIFVKCDVTNDEELEALFKKAKSAFGTLDIVINNAGVVWENRFKFMMDINLTAMVQGTMLGIKYMGTDRGGNGGVIINIASIAGVLPIDTVPLYSMTKHAIVGFSRAIGRVSPAAHGIRINAISPTLVDTELVQFKPEDIAKGQMYVPNVDFEEREHVMNNVVCGGELVSVRDVAECGLVVIKDETLSGHVMVVSPKGSGLASDMAATLDHVLDKFVPVKIK